MGGPGHGQLSAPQVEVPVAAIDFERVHEHADDSATKDDDEQAQAGSQSAEPMRAGDNGQLHAGALPAQERRGREAGAVVGLGDEGGTDEPRDVVWRWRGRRRGRRGGAKETSRGCRGRREVSSGHGPGRLEAERWLSALVWPERHGAQRMDEGIAT